MSNMVCLFVLILFLKLMPCLYGEACLYAVDSKIFTLPAHELLYDDLDFIRLSPDKKYAAARFNDGNHYLFTSESKHALNFQSPVTWIRIHGAYKEYIFLRHGFRRDYVLNVEDQTFHEFPENITVSRVSENGVLFTYDSQDGSYDFALQYAGEKVTTENFNLQKQITDLNAFGYTFKKGEKIGFKFWDENKDEIIFDGAFLAYTLLDMYSIVYFEDHYKIYHLVNKKFVDFETDPIIISFTASKCGKILFEQMSKFGVMYENLQVVIPPVYEDIRLLNGNNAIVAKDIEGKTEWYLWDRGQEVKLLTPDDLLHISGYGCGHIYMRTHDGEVFIQKPESFFEDQ